MEKGGSLLEIKDAQDILLIHLEKSVVLPRFQNVLCFKKRKKVFIWLCPALVAACGTFVAACRIFRGAHRLSSCGAGAQ